MATRIFPDVTNAKTWGWRGIAWDITKTAEFNTTKLATESDLEARRARGGRPKWTFLIHWNLLRDQMDLARNATKTAPMTELQEIVNFYLDGLGDFAPFFFRDRTDKRVTSQAIATGDGTTTDFPFVRQWKSGGYVEPVGGIAADSIAEPLIVRVDGTPVSSALYDINDPYDGWISFDTPPGNGLAITADFSYYFKVRFKEGKASFHTFAKDFWELQKVELVSVKNPTVAP